MGASRAVAPATSGVVLALVALLAASSISGVRAVHAEAEAETEMEARASASVSESGYLETVETILRGSLGGEHEVNVLADLDTIVSADAEEYAAGEVVNLNDPRTGARRGDLNPPHRPTFPYKLHFAKFANTYKRVYKNEEIAKRYTTWKNCVDRIAWHNSVHLPSIGASYRLSSNRLCDKEHSERLQMLGYRSKKSVASQRTAPNGVPDPNDHAAAAAAADRATHPTDWDTPEEHHIAEEMVRESPTDLDPETIDVVTMPHFRQALEEGSDADEEDEELAARDHAAMVEAYSSAARSRMSSTMRRAADEQLATTGSLDWRSLGAVTPVRYQGSCGNCWAYAVTGVVEGAWKLAGHPLTILSPQQVTDCSRESPNSGCSGGDPSTGLQYLAQHGGQCAESSYHTGTGPQGACRACTPVAQVNQPQYDDSGVENTLETHVRTGPVAVAVYATSFQFQHYSSGVFSSSDCNAQGAEVNHAVLVVGFGTDPQHGAYWTIKNTWDTQWGEQGYVRLQRGVNRCLIATEYALSTSKGAAPSSNTGAITAPAAPATQPAASSSQQSVPSSPTSFSPSSSSMPSMPSMPSGGSPGGASPGGASPGGASPGGASPGGASPGGASPGGASPGGASPGGGSPGGKGKHSPGGPSGGSPSTPASSSAPSKPATPAAPTTPSSPAGATGATGAAGPAAAGATGAAGGAHPNPSGPSAATGAAGTGAAGTGAPGTGAAGSSTPAPAQKKGDPSATPAAGGQKSAEKSGDVKSGESKSVGEAKGGKGKTEAEKQKQKKKSHHKKKHPAKKLNAKKHHRQSSHKKTKKKKRHPKKHGKQHHARGRRGSKRHRRNARKLKSAKRNVRGGARRSGR